MTAIGLGTVQFGVDYGVSNHQGKTSLVEVGQILEYAAMRGVRILDTAALYGNSEQVLGQVLSDNHSFQIVTKTPSFEGNRIAKHHVGLLETTFFQSLENLCQSSVYGLLIHHVDDLLKPGAEALIDKLLQLKQSGKVKKIGVSVYNATQIDAVLGKMDVDLIQLPINVFDQRLIASEHLRKLKTNGVEIHARSVFLQGLLLMSLDKMPHYFSPILPQITTYHQEVQHSGLSLLEAALGFVLQLNDIDTVLCGVNSQQQLEEILSVDKLAEINLDFSRFAVDDTQYVNPANWQLS
jgi:aryl-alcohol dehydrogenase-like predicted oxidoreductase